MHPRTDSRSEPRNRLSVQLIEQAKPRELLNAAIPLLLGHDRATVYARLTKVIARGCMRQPARPWALRQFPPVVAGGQAHSIVVGAARPLLSSRRRAGRAIARR